MGLLKEKSAYRPRRHEGVLAWIVTGTAGVVLALWLWKSCAPLS